MHTKKIAGGMQNAQELLANSVEAAKKKRLDKSTTIVDYMDDELGLCKMHYKSAETD